MACLLVTLVHSRDLPVFQSSYRSFDALVTKGAAHPPHPPNGHRSIEDLSSSTSHTERYRGPQLIHLIHRTVTDLSRASAHPPHPPNGIEGLNSPTSYTERYRVPQLIHFIHRTVTCLSRASAHTPHTPNGIEDLSSSTSYTERLPV